MKMDKKRKKEENDSEHKANRDSDRSFLRKERSNPEGKMAAALAYQHQAVYGGMKVRKSDSMPSAES
jgi:hypothetical protein